MQVLGGIARDASPGLVRLSGSFTTNGSNAVVTTRPSKGEFTITRKGAGIYEVKFNMATQSVVWGDAWLTLSSAIIGNGSVAVTTSEVGFCNASGDFMTSDGTNYKSDPTQTKVLVLVYNAASNHTSGTLTDPYNLTLGNTSSKANARVNFEFCFATMSMNA